MKHLIKFLAISIIIINIVSCKKTDDPPPPDPNVTFKAVLNGASESTPNTSTNTGAATLVFNSTTKIFTLAVTHTVPTPTNGHIHKAAVGVSGPPVFAFTTFTSPINYTSVALDAAQEADLNAGLYYVNIHSATPYAAGEIRGQLIKQ
jgi:CHRD domain